MEAQPNRRDLFKGLITGAWSLIVAALGAPAAAYLLVPPRAHKGEQWADAGAAAELESNAPAELVFRRNRQDGWKLTSEKAVAWVTKGADGRVTAYAPQCTHLGCAYHWEEQKQEFVCPCHSSTFSLDGRVLSGPAPRPLDRYEVKVENGRIMVGPLARQPEQKV